MNRKIFRIVTAIIIVLILILGIIYLIDRNRMRDNEPVLFSTWGYDYAPPEDIYLNESTNNSKLVLMYEIIIDDIIKQDEALNNNAQYISLDVDSFVAPIERGKGTIQSKYLGLEDEEKNALLQYCEKYHTDIKSCSFEELKENGLFNEKEVRIDGILIYLESVEKITENSAIITIGKYRSGLGAVFPKYKLTYKNNIWNIEVLSMAIS